MPALIDNYTASLSKVAQNPSICVYRQYIERGNILTSGIVVKADGDNPYSLNSRIMSLLDEYSRLEDNWDDDGGLAPRANNIRRAKYLTDLMERYGQSIYHAAPGPEGEIMLDLRNKTKTRSVEIIFYPDREVVVFFPDTDRPFQEVFTDDKMPEILRWLNKK